MKDKAYIVANEQQEREVLEKLEREGLVWIDGEKPTEFIPIKQSAYGAAFPYALIDRGYVAWANLFQLKEDIDIVYDGRKEDKMSEKYVVSQEFMNELNGWKKRENTNLYSVLSYDISMLPDDIKRWWNYPEINNFEQNNRLIAIIRWVNGEDVFEVEKPKKWVVRSKGTDDDGEYWWLSICEIYGLKRTYDKHAIELATKFDTKEEAESWANSHQEVIEVEE